MVRWVLTALLVFTACPTLDNPLLCSNCGGGSSGGIGDAGGSGSVGDAGGNGSDGGGPGADGGCNEQWLCSDWEATAAGTATRTCLDGNGCGTTTTRPTQGPLPLPALDLNYYKCKVQPLLERTCSALGCHGTETDRVWKLYARGRLRNDEVVPQVSGCLGGQVNLAQDATGTVMCAGWSRLTATEWRRNFDRARAYGLALNSPDESPLLTQPTSGNALAHAGVKPFAPQDASYVVIRQWLAGAASGPCDAGFN